MASYLICFTIVFVFIGGSALSTRAGFESKFTDLGLILVAFPIKWANDLVKNNLPESISTTQVNTLVYIVSVFLLLTEIFLVAGIIFGIYSLLQLIF